MAYNLSEEQKFRILRNYLKHFLVSFKDDFEYLKNTAGELSNYIVYSNDSNNLKKFAAYMLLLEGRQEYISCSTDELMAKRLNDYDTEDIFEPTYRDYQSTKLLILRHYGNYQTNKLLYETVAFICEHRKEYNLKTIVLANNKIPTIENLAWFKTIRYKNAVQPAINKKSKERNIAKSKSSTSKFI